MNWVVLEMIQIKLTFICLASSHKLNIRIEFPNKIYNIPFNIATPATVSQIEFSTKFYNKNNNNNLHFHLAIDHTAKLVQRFNCFILQSLNWILIIDCNSSLYTPFTHVDTHSWVGPRQIDWIGDQINYNAPKSVRNKNQFEAYFETSPVSILFFASIWLFSLFSITVWAKNGKNTRKK